MSDSVTTESVKDEPLQALVQVRDIVKIFDSGEAGRYEIKIEGREVFRAMDSVEQPGKIFIEFMYGWEFCDPDSYSIVTLLPEEEWD